MKKISRRMPVLSYTKHQVKPNLILDLIVSEKSLTQISMCLAFVSWVDKGKQGERSEMVRGEKK